LFHGRLPSVSMNEVKHLICCSQFDEHPDCQKQENARQRGIWRLALALVALQSFDFGFHDYTIIFATRNLRAVAELDVQISE